MTNKVIVKTPQVMTVGKSHLHVPDIKTGERFPRMSKDGKRNLNTKYKVKIALELSNPEHLKLIESIREFEAELNVDGAKVHSILKPKMEKNKEGEFAPRSDIVTIELSALDKISVFEGPNQVGGDKLVLDSRTSVVVETELVKFSFNGSDGKLISGIKLVPLAVNVLARPARISIPKKK